MVSHSRKKKDQPSGQQKRKHQITYLAHQVRFTCISHWRKAVSSLFMLFEDLREFYLTCLYLILQAKERELELKNDWANNRQNRKATQSKYGF